MASSTARHRSLGRIDRGAHVTAVAASHTSEKKLRQKKNRGAIFFWRRPLRVTARLDESTVNFFIFFSVFFFVNCFRYIQNLGIYLVINL